MKFTDIYPNYMGDGPDFNTPLCYDCRDEVDVVCLRSGDVVCVGCAVRRDLKRRDGRWFRRMLRKIFGKAEPDDICGCLLGAQHLCRNPVAWIRRTQFCGDHPFCEHHARLEKNRKSVV